MNFNITDLKSSYKFQKFHSFAKQALQKNLVLLSSASDQTEKL